MVDPRLAQAIDAVLEPGFLRKLDRLRTLVRHGLGNRLGNTPMPRGAQSAGIEIESYRPYDLGDDPRRIDWNAYGRLDQLVVRLFRAEREVPHYLIVDTSGSMGFPVRDGKLPYAAALSASLASVAVRNHDPARVLCIAESISVSPTVRHLAQLPLLREFLVTLQSSGQTALGPGLRDWLSTRPTPGVAIVISDFLMPVASYEHELAALAAKRFTVSCVRVIGADERDPGRFFRAGRIVDAETGRDRRIRFDRGNRARYENALQAHLEELQRTCAKSGVRCIVADTGEPIERALWGAEVGGLLH